MRTTKLVCPLTPTKTRTTKIWNAQKKEQASKWLENKTTPPKMSSWWIWRQTKMEYVGIDEQASMWRVGKRRAVHDQGRG
jgi:hypothetical protein